jgi:hypothetical protein
MASALREPPSDTPAEPSADDSPDVLRRVGPGSPVSRVRPFFFASISVSAGAKSLSFFLQLISAVAETGN